MEKLTRDTARGLGKTDFKVGRLGELLVEQQLVERGWHPVRLDTSQMAANADLLAINKAKRVSIQVKTTNAYHKHAHSDFLGFGYASSHLQKETPVFNSKLSPLIADIIVAVHYHPTTPRFVVMPVGYAELLCQAHIKHWYDIPLKKGGRRTTNFPIYLSFSRAPSTNTEHHLRMMNGLLKYENAWNIMKESPDQLRDPACWSLT
jgi:hypothetical protein